MNTNQVQVTGGHVYEVKKHKHTDKDFLCDYGAGKVVGIRADAKNARERYAFVVLFGSKYMLMSRCDFRLT